MQKPIRVHVDMPESYAILDKDNKAAFLNVVNKLVENVAFSVFNDTFLADAQSGLDVPAMATVLVNNVVYSNDSRGYTMDGSENPLLLPLGELAQHLIMELYKMGHGYIAQDAVADNHGFKLTVIENN